MVKLSADLNLLLGLAQAAILAQIDSEAGLLPDNNSARMKRQQFFTTAEREITKRLKQITLPALQSSENQSPVTTRAWEYLHSLSTRKQDDTPPIKRYEGTKPAYALLAQIYGQQNRLLNVFAALDTCRYAELSADEQTRYPDLQTRTAEADNAASAIATACAYFDPRIPNLIETAKTEPLTEFEQDNLRRIELGSIEDRAIPQNLVQQRVAAQNKCREAYVQANSDYKAGLLTDEENLFAGVVGPLDDLFAIYRQEAQLMQAELQKQGTEVDDPTDAYIRCRYGIDRKTVEGIMSTLRETLPQKLNAIKEAQQNMELTNIPDIAEDKQIEIVSNILQRMGVDPAQILWRKANGGMVSTSGGHSDTRFTIAVQKNLLHTIKSAMHEAGHGLHFSNQPAEFPDQPASGRPEYWMNETQGMIWDCQVFPNKSFLKFLEGEISRVLGTEFDRKAFSADNMHAHATKLANETKRINADNVSYPLHVLVRAEIEMDLLDSKISGKDVESIWNRRTKDLLGIDLIERRKDTPRDIIDSVSKGPLDDNHWSNGNFHFTYALGRLGAAQFMGAIRHRLTNFDQYLEAGNLRAVTNFLIDNVHSWGYRKDGPDLIHQVTGQQFGADALLAQINRDYPTKGIVLE